MVETVSDVPHSRHASTAPQRIRPSTMWLIDDSLSLINRTGAHVIARELVSAFADRAVIRRWRLLGRDCPEGLQRTVCARLMLKELSWFADRPLRPWPESPGVARRLFLDPLYVLQATLRDDDVVLCHDIGPLTHPQLYSTDTAALYRSAYRKVREVGPHMVFVSETSQAAFRHRFGERYTSMTTIPLFLRRMSEGGEPQPVTGIERPFLLSVGALETRKNHLTTIQAFQASGLAQRGCHLVIVGPAGDAAQAIAMAAQGVPGVKLLGYQTDAHLLWLYRQAQAFVLPSLLEGFGMPALEAAHHGLPCVVSGDSALNEAIGGLGLTVDALSVPQLAERMVEVMGWDASRRAQTSDQLRRHAVSLTRERFLQRWSAVLC